MVQDANPNRTDDEIDALIEKSNREGRLSPADMDRLAFLVATQILDELSANPGSVLEA